MHKCFRQTVFLFHRLWIIQIAYVFGVVRKQFRQEQPQKQQMYLQKAFEFFRKLKTGQIANLYISIINIYQY